MKNKAIVKNFYSLLFFCLNLHFNLGDKYMAKVIAVTSGKGGVGKTTFCVNVGNMLSQMKQKVLLIDGDFGLNNLDVVMGVENKIVFDFIDIIENKCRAKQALIQDFNNQFLWILPSNHTYSNFTIQSWHIGKIINELKNDFDYIFIDCPAGIDGNFRKIIEIVDSSIVITTPHISAVRDADKTISCLKSCFIDDVCVVVNRARGDLILNGEMIKIETIGEYLDAEILGVIPESDDISCQLLVGGAVKGGSDVEISYKMISLNILNQEKNIFDCTKKYKGFWGGIRKNLKRIV